MKVRDLLSQDVDIDVYDDVTEELGIAFCGPLALTAEGLEKFQDVLDYGISIHEGYVIVNVDAGGSGWKTRLRKAKEFFEAAAGPEEDYSRWFKEAEA